MQQRLEAKVSESWGVFQDGFLSGFLSSLVTTVINAFVKTGKNIVRVIREGFFSLLRAVKMICFPPEGMDRKTAAHEASKIIAAGLGVIVGVGLEESVSAMIATIPILTPVAGPLYAVLVGAGIGLMTTLVV